MYARCAAAARKAIALDGTLADAHAELAYVLMVGYDPSGAAEELSRAIALDPSASATRELMAKAYEWTERPTDAIAEAERAVLADPLSASTNAELGYALYFARRYPEALAQLAKVGGIRPPLRRAPEYAAQVYAAMGRWPEAISVLRPVVSREPLARGLLGYALARSGERADATRILDGLLADEAAGSATASEIAEVYVGLRDYDRAFLWIERSFDDYSLRPSIMGPMFADLRADPRFDRVRRRLGTRPP
jgi:tetratricopeptide (TPR) repeat protein